MNKDVRGQTEEDHHRSAGTPVTILSQDDQDFISLTDIARHRNSQEPSAVIQNWMRGRSTIEFLGLWEKLSNPAFKPLDFEGFRDEAGVMIFDRCTGGPQTSGAISRTVGK